MSNFREVRLREVADVTVGFVGTMADQYREAGVPFLRSLNVRPHRINLDDIKYVDSTFHGRLAKSALRPGDVVTVRTGKPGQSAVIPEWLTEANCSDLVISRPGPDLDARWLSYYLNFVTDTQISGHLVGAVQQHFNVRSAESLVLQLPARRDQEGIAEVLGSLDDKIAANERLGGTLNRFIEANYVRASRHADSRLENIYSVTELDFGEPFRGDHFVAPGIGRPLVRIRDLKSHRPKIWTTEVRAKESVIQAGDVLVGMDAEFRASWWLGEPAVLNQRVLRARGTCVGAAYLACALAAPLAALEREKSATTVIHLNKSDLVRSTILIPPKEVLSEFERVAEAALTYRLGLAAEDRALIATRDELLPLLMSGKVRVREAEERASEVL